MSIRMKVTLHLYNIGSEEPAHVEVLAHEAWSPIVDDAKHLLRHRRRASKVEVRADGWLMKTMFAKPWVPGQPFDNL